MNRFAVIQDRLKMDGFGGIGTLGVVNAESDCLVHRSAGIGRVIRIRNTWLSNSNVQDVAGD